MEFDTKAFGHRIRTERYNRQWSQAQLAESTGISISHISKIERGNCDCSIGCLVKIVEALELSTDYLLYNKSNCVKPTSQITGEIIGNGDEIELHINVKGNGEVYFQSKK